MEKRQAESRAATEEEQKGTAAGDQEMTDEGASAAQSTSTMIDTTGGRRGGGTLIGSSNPDFEVDITEEDERRGALAFIADQEKKTKFRDRLALQLESV